MITGDADDILSRLASSIGHVDSGRRGLAEMKELLDLAGALSPKVRFKPNLARGQGYYTGPVYEVQIETPRLGSIAGGGRYDGLIGIFAGNQIPATGASFGIDRMVAALAEMGQGAGKPGAQILICHFGSGAAKAALKLAAELRDRDLNCDLYPQEAPLSRQLKYADKKGFPYTVIIGEDEVKTGEYVIKDLKANSQVKVEKKGVADHLKRRLFGNE